MKQYMANLFLKLTTESVKDASARNTDSPADKRELQELQRARDQSEREVRELARENERLQQALEESKLAGKKALEEEREQASRREQALRKDQDERNKEAKELNAALLQRQETMENKHLQHQVQLTDNHVAAQQQLSEASNKTIETVKDALNEVQLRSLQDLKDQMAIERESHRQSERHTQEIAMQLISVRFPSSTFEY